MVKTVEMPLFEYEEDIRKAVNEEWGKVMRPIVLCLFDCHLMALANEFFTKNYDGLIEDGSRDLYYSWVEQKIVSKINELRGKSDGVN